MDRRHPGAARRDDARRGVDTFGYGGVAVDARRPGTVVVSTNNRWAAVDTLYRTTDGGRTWTSLKDSAVLDVSRDAVPHLRRRRAQVRLVDPGRRRRPVRLARTSSTAPAPPSTAPGT